MSKLTPDTVPRLPLVEAPEDPLAREMFANIAASRGILNLHRMMAHAPALMKASYDTAMAIRNDTLLPRPIVELVILRTAQVLCADYIWGRHVPLARACGVTDAQIAELSRWGDSTAFTPAEKATLGFAEKAAQHLPIADAEFAALKQHFSPREIVEITMLVGSYVGTAILLAALSVPDEPG
jgi:alkylhydroperoxidase family enzyme